MRRFIEQNLGLNAGAVQTDYPSFRKMILVVLKEDSKTKTQILKKILEQVFWPFSKELGRASASEQQGWISAKLS